MSDSIEIIKTHHVPGSINNMTLTAIDHVFNKMHYDVYQVESLAGHVPGAKFSQKIKFQVGNPAFYGFNGLTMEVLLAVCKHRLEGFQMTEHSCKENEAALEHITQAMQALQQRTLALQKK